MQFITKKLKLKSLGVPKILKFPGYLVFRQLSVRQSKVAELLLGIKISNEREAELRDIFVWEIFFG